MSPRLRHRVCTLDPLAAEVACARRRIPRGTTTIMAATANDRAADVLIAVGQVTALERIFRAPAGPAVRPVAAGGKDDA